VPQEITSALSHVKYTLMYIRNLLWMDALRFLWQPWLNFVAKLRTSSNKHHFLFCQKLIFTERLFLMANIFNFLSRSYILYRVYVYWISPLKNSIITMCYNYSLLTTPLITVAFRSSFSKCNVKKRLIQARETSIYISFYLHAWWVGLNFSD